jgi:hypothetical protein
MSSIGDRFDRSAGSPPDPASAGAWRCGSMQSTGSAQLGWNGDVVAVE